MQRLLALAILVALMSACSEPSLKRPVNEALQPYLARPGVEPAGENAVVVYLTRNTGSVQEGRGKGAGTPWTEIRLLVRMGSQLPAAALFGDSDKIIDEGDGFTRIVSGNRPPQRGVLRFSGPCGLEVLSTQSSGDTTEKGTYLAEMRMNGMFLQYLYGAEGHQDHRRYADWAYNWYMNGRAPCFEPSRAQ
ncbi:hypothetical protein PWP89_03140 [Stenotrophomonas rhizophila]|jgi:hypothetical protein|uniref:hypothetical protein n=1 Tax=Stenotrophomonas rhizophila TaxID=216778 RepID=UPI000B82045B|nr:hypothetical protein [Stenotrophomonas rhizophila]